MNFQFLPKVNPPVVRKLRVDFYILPHLINTHHKLLKIDIKAYILTA